MAARYRRIKVDATGEQDLLTGLIVSDEFCKRVLPMVRPDHLTGSGSKAILDWVCMYYERYEKAPGKEVQTIYNVEKINLSDAEQAVVERILTSLSERFTNNKGHNWAYQSDLARDFIRNRNLEILTDTVKVLRDRGDIQRAEEVVRDFMEIRSSTSDRVFPLIDKELQRSVLTRTDDGLFKLRGAAGEVFGWWQEGWLVAFIGPPKRGKTWWLAEVAVQALADHGLRVLFISLEMSKEDMTKRFMQIVSSLPKDKGKVLIPTWDCARNQSDSCELKERTNHEPIPTDTHDRPSYREGTSYRPCTFCKTRHEYLKHYQVASWFKYSKPREAFEDAAIAEIEAFSMQYGGGNLVLECFPRFSATVEDIESCIEDNVANGFIPDMVVVDYAGILREERDRGGSDDWRVDDRTWKKLAGVGAKKHVIMVSAGQGNAKAMVAKSMNPTQIAGYTGISAHIDLGVSLNQIVNLDKGINEREQMIMRLGALAVRHGEWPNEEVYVLQNFKLGQPAMDSFAVSVGHRLIVDEPEGEYED